MVKVKRQTPRGELHATQRQQISWRAVNKKSVEGKTRVHRWRYSHSCFVYAPLSEWLPLHFWNVLDRMQHTDSEKTVLFVIPPHCLLLKSASTCLLNQPFHHFHQKVGNRDSFLKFCSIKFPRDPRIALLGSFGVTRLLLIWLPITL